MNIIRFNSTLVRLRLYHRRRLVPCPLVFQFHIGSIKTSGVEIVNHLISEFQFHIGSIKTYNHPLPSSLTHVFQFHIGSIKTLLSCPAAKSRITGFNSTLVRLRLGKTALVGTGGAGFNSTLVRLRHENMRGTGFGWVVFQFHIGSIKTHPIPELGERLRLFQFHIGSIKTGTNVELDICFGSRVAKHVNESAKLLRWNN